MAAERNRPAGRGAGAAAPRIAVIGAGWAGLAAAVEATHRGALVTVFEMAPQAGGRARSVPVKGGTGSGQLRDNGQHILIGAYTETLALMRRVGADPARLFWRGPLSLQTPQGRGLQWPPGAPIPAFVRGVLGARGWRWRDRLALLGVAAGWGLRGFQCPQQTSVADLCAALPSAVRQDLIEPLCVAALNTQMADASGQVFLRVLRDALFAGPGSADLLLPRAPLSALLPTPALAWLQRHGATLRLGCRTQALAPLETVPGWRVDGDTFDGVVLACSAVEAARLTARIAPDWSHMAAALPHEPIVTAWLHDPALRLPQPMMALTAAPDAPAQFVFDLGALGVAAGEFAFVASGAAPWVARGLPATAAAMLAQARQAFTGAFTRADDIVLRAIVAERRATFACTPGLTRAPGRIAPRLWAAGDHVAGPYPATLEGAVRSGLDAARALV